MLLFPPIAQGMISTALYLCSLPTLSPGICCTVVSPGGREVIAQSFSDTSLPRRKEESRRGVEMLGHSGLRALQTGKQGWGVQCAWRGSAELGSSGR